MRGMLPCRAWTDRCRDTPPEPRKARIKTGLPVAQNFSTGCFACNATCARTEQTVFGLPDRLSSCCATRRQATALCHYVGHIFSAIPPDQKFHAPLPQGIRYTLRSGFRGKFLRIARNVKMCTASVSCASLRGFFDIGAESFRHAAWHTAFAKRVDVVSPYKGAGAQLLNRGAVSRA